MTLPNPLPQPDASWVVDERSLTLFVEKLKEPPADRAWYELRREAERIALVPGFDRLITLDANAIKELPHQIDVAQRVLRDMGGRAILADEVGLGKTIEASIVYKELAVRGLARRALILTPASLVGQWQGELEEKFFERFDTPTDPDDWQRVTKAIISHDRARTRRHAEEILRHRWDLVIVDEAHLYQRTTDFLRRLYREGFIQPAEQEETEEGAPRRRTKKGILQLAVIHLRQRLCSSSRALAESLAHLAESERISPQYRVIATQLAKRAERIKTHAKLDVLTKLLKETPDRVVVFSDHRPTIQLIEERVKQLNRKPIVYWGAHSTADRDKRIRAFHDDKRSVLIATRAGSEGRNLQFCNVLVNYDLPWNPMVVEQRIGRLHRIGQTREVHIVNLAAAGTIESYILELLDRKIKLFELVVGELDLILGEFGGAHTFEGRLADEWLAADNEEDFARRVETRDHPRGAGGAPASGARRHPGGHRVTRRRKPQPKPQGKAKRPAPAPEAAEADPLADARIRPFVERYCDLAGVKLLEKGSDLRELKLPPAERAHFQGRESVRLALSLDALERNPAAEIAVLGSPFLTHLIEAIRTRAGRLSLGMIPPPSPVAADDEDVAPSVAPPVPVRDGTARQSSVGLAAHPIGRLVARVVLRAGAAVEEAVVESDVFDLSTGTRSSDDVARF